MARHVTNRQHLSIFVAILTLATLAFASVAPVEAAGTIVACDPVTGVGCGGNMGGPTTGPTTGGNPNCPTNSLTNTINNLLSSFGVGGINVCGGSTPAPPPTNNNPQPCPPIPLL